MKCHYCTQIATVQPGYSQSQPRFDVGSETPRCPRHWRYLCALCLRSWHFQAICYCPKQRDSYCPRCALAERRVEQPFWHWHYYWERRCPFCADWHPGLDFREFQGKRPPRRSLSRELQLERPPGPGFTRAEEEHSDEAVGALWDRNAQDWARRCGPAGDLSRAVSDPVLFELLGDVAGDEVLDAGCGEGYLCRLLAQRGATVWGVENAAALVERARERTPGSPGGKTGRVRYLHGSIAAMSEVPAGHMDAVVCNNVLMYCAHLPEALGEIRRVVKPGGRVVVVMTHPCFWGPATDWIRTPPDALREEEWLERRVGSYFDTRPGRFVPAGYQSPLVYFHRSLTDYFREFRSAFLEVTDLVEPTLAPALTLPSAFRARVGSLPISLALRLRPA